MEKISLVIPAFNEEKGIAEVLDDISSTLENSPYDYEIIVVDDGSTDKTSEIIQSRKQIRLIEHEENLGYGAALKSGIKKASGDIIVITDADGTYPSSPIPGLIAELEEHDMTVGSRTGKNVKIPLIRRPAKYMINIFANFLIERKIPDLNSGLRAFRKNTVRRLFHYLPSGFSFTTTITLLFLSNDFSVKYIPIDYHHRKGKSKIKPIRDTLNFIFLIIRMILYFNPLKVFIPTSMFLMFLSIGQLVYDIFIVKNIGDTVVLLWSSSIIVGAIGMLADMIAKRMGDTFYQDR